MCREERMNHTMFCFYCMKTTTPQKSPYLFSNLHDAVSHVTQVLTHFQSTYMQDAFSSIYCGLCCMNNEAQCPTRVPPTPCSNSMLMTTACNSSQSQPGANELLWHSCVGKILSQRRGELLFFFLFQIIEWSIMKHLKVKLAIFWASEVCGHYHQGGDPQTRANFGNTSNSRRELRKETEEYFYLRLHSSSLSTTHIPKEFRRRLKCKRKQNAVICKSL